MFLLRIGADQRDGLVMEVAGRPDGTELGIDKVGATRPRMGSCRRRPAFSSFALLVSMTAILLEALAAP